MAVSPSFRAFVLEQFGRAIGRVRARSMFGGAGIYVGDVCFALLSDDTLYFRVDDASRGDFEARGMRPFRPREGHAALTSYYQVPEEVLEEPEVLRPWADRALTAARTRKAAQARRRR